MTHQIKLSVIMPVYNGEAFLSQATESILNQTFRDFEFIIIDNGSTDKTPEILSRYAGRDSRIRVHLQEKRGVAHSMNLAVSLAKGRYIARMDADDIALPARFQLQFDFLENHPEIGVLGGAAAFITADGKPISIFRPPCTDPEIRSATDGWFTINATVMMKREIALAVQSRQQLRGAIDHDFLLRALEQCQFANLDEVVLQRRIHADQVSITQMKNQVMSVLAARAAVTFRKLGRPDPLDTVPEINAHTLEKLGVDRSEIEKASAWHYAYWMELLRRDHPDAALNIVDQLLHTPGFSPDRSSRANARLVAASVYRAKGQPAKAAASVALAILVEPSLAGQFLKRGFATL